MEKIEQALERARRQQESRQRAPEQHRSVTPGPSDTDKLEQAFEKARRQRDRHPPRDHPQPAPGAGHDEVAAAPSADALAGGSRLKRTRGVSVDRQRLSENRLVNGHDAAGLVDVFRILRTQVLHRMNALEANTLAITSPGMSEGKTLIAANLAISLSQFARHTVLLVDLDLRRPGVHKLFAIDQEPGLTNHLLSDTPLAECLVNPGIERLVLLPSGAPLRASSETLSSEKMATLSKELKNRYPDRLVIYDLPPLLPTDDALVFLKYVDCSLLVVEEGRTQRPEIERALDLLDEHEPIGTVLNKARWAQRSSGYGYGDDR